MKGSPKTYYNMLKKLCSMKQDKKGQISYDLNYLCNLKHSKNKIKEIQFVVSRCGVQREEELNEGIQKAQTSTYKTNKC